MSRWSCGAWRSWTGRNRLRAALRAGGTVRFEELGDDVDVYAFVSSANLYRRHLTTSQRAMIAIRLVELSVRAQQLHARREATEKANRPSDADGGRTAAASGGATAPGMVQSPPPADRRPLARLPQLGVVSDENHGFWLPARPGVPAKPGGSEFVACQNPV